MFRRTDKLKGFTLIELLVVIAIIAILAVVIILNLTQARKKARDAQRKDDMRSLTIAIESYYDDQNKYPGTLNRTYKSTKTADSLGGAIFGKTGTYLGTYLKGDVKDPLNNSSYYYYYIYKGDSKYTLCAKDMEIDSNANSGSEYCLNSD